MNTPTPSEIIAWFRDKATEFNRIADTLEITFETQPHLGNGKRDPSQTQLKKAISVDDIKKIVLDKNSARPASIADELDVDKDDVNEIIDQHPSVFERIGKGWIKIKE